jgi:hypothetical protein
MGTFDQLQVYTNAVQLHTELFHLWRGKVHVPGVKSLPSAKKSANFIFYICLLNETQIVFYSHHVP